MLRSMTLAALLSVLLFAPSGQAGTLAEDQNVPNLVEALPPPPPLGSIDFQRDKAIFCQTRGQCQTERWKQAVWDAEDRKHLSDLFLDSFGIRITPDDTPATHALLQEVMKYVGRAINPAKDHWKRIRPFDFFGMPSSTCTPHDEHELSTNGSYPSGHTSRGWGLALVLAEISPERQGAILKRGYELGQSRVICGVHWQSDVDTARLGASAAVVQMHNNPQYLDMLQIAKQEIADLRRRGVNHTAPAEAASIHTLPEEAFCDSCLSLSE